MRSEMGRFLLKASLGGPGTWMGSIGTSRDQSLVNEGQSLSARMVGSERALRNVLAAISRGERASYWPMKNSVMVAGMEACSKTSLMTVPRAIHGEIRMAGTRTPRRSKRNASGVPVALGWATKPSGIQAGGGT